MQNVTHHERNGESGFEGKVITGVLLSVGALGVALGLAHPDGSLALSLGALTIFFVVRATLADALGARRPRGAE